jgi:uncharacterized DUF497 family protein
VEHISQARGFDGDEANVIKIWEKHSVSQSECEQIFFNKPLVVTDDVKHSGVEQRYYVLGATDQGCTLFLVFTMRGGLIRVITAREMNRKERRLYQDAKEEGSS